MKKFFSLIALVGVFAACQPEELTTAFQVTPAVVNFVADADCAAPGFVKSDVNFGYPTVSANSRGVIEAGSAAVTASYGGVSLSNSVSYPKVLAGGEATVNTFFTFPYDRAGYTIEVVPVDTVVVPSFYILEAASHGHGYAKKQTVEVAGETIEVQMLENANDYVLLDSYKYNTFKGDTLVKASVVNSNKDFAEDFEASVALFDGEIKVTEVKKDFKVSAWALYNVVNVVFKNTVNCKVTATPADDSTVALADEVIGTFSYVYFDSLVEPVEMAHPSHASHYVEPTADGHYHGHGHGHGEFENAGGGLVEAE